MKTFAGIPKNTVLRPSGPCSHLFVIITTPDGEPPKVVVVNVSTKRSKSDTTTVLYQGEHSFLTKPESIIRYDLAEIIEIDQLITAVNNGHLTALEDMSDAVFQRICAGIEASPDTPEDIKNQYQKLKPVQQDAA
ncbi:hypothetical protein [Aeromonas veronii]|uniref:hypothetical protein n=1 Tax=Aeromonas veronii TaxID=654 RepID=UPI001F2507F3|nr:hypothetical protein [Aeromonas veronii]MCF5859795.1 hypothetical protein [Aeromonas veronii]